MTIHLPNDLENSVRAEVLSGHFASEEDVVTAIVRDYFQRKQQQVASNPAATTPEAAAPVHKPIWERILERTADIPDEVWDKIPTDLSEQHDHYLYGTPKRTKA
jgi:Arc/MetJ-type ribon-helix-helix transcriptional regulator